MFQLRVGTAALRSFLVFGYLGFIATIVRGQEPFAAIEKDLNGQIGVVAMMSGKTIEHRSNERFPMCSTFKLLAAAAVLQNVDKGRERLDRFVSYTPADLLEYAPVTRAHVNEGGMLLGDLCAAAIIQSDNTAGNLLLDAIGGPEGLTKFARSIGDNATSLNDREPALNDVKPGEERNSTTPGAMCRDLQKFFTGDVLTETSRDRLEAWMQRCETGTALIRVAVDSRWRVGDKTGRSGLGQTNDLAIIRRPSGAPIFLCIFAFGAGRPSEEREKAIVATTREAIAKLERK